MASPPPQPANGRDMDLDRKPLDDERDRREDSRDRRDDLRDDRDDRRDDRGSYDRGGERAEYSGPRQGSQRYSPPPKPRGAPAAEPNNCIGIFGLSIRTNEDDLRDIFGKAGRVENVVIVYDQRSARSRGFGFITMDTIESAQRAIDQISGIDLHGRRVRVDFSSTTRAHQPTPGEYRGRRSDDYGDRGSFSDRDRRDDRRDYRPRDDYYDRRDDRRDYRPRDHGRDSRRGGYDDRDRDYRRSPPPAPRRPRSLSRSRSPPRRRRSLSPR